MLAAAALSSVVTISSVPFVPTVIVAVSLLEPVIVMTLPSIATSSTVRAVSVPNDVILVCAAVVRVTSAMYVFTRLMSARLFVPPPPSSTIISSESARAAPISVPPSISNALSETLFGFDIVSSVDSAIAALAFKSALTLFVIVL